MKKIIAWPLAWACFWFGDIASRILNRVPDWDWLGWRWMYALYSKPMQWSYLLNEWAGLKIWK